MYIVHAEAIDRLEEVGLLTTDPEEREKCCGIVRDDAGRCQNRPHHPVYIAVQKLGPPR